MKFNKKGFTLIEVLAVIVLIGILSSVVIGAVTKYQKKAQDSVYENYNKNLKSAANDYLLNNGGDVPEQNKSIKIDASILINNQYIDELSDPIDNKKKCYGYVLITNNGNLSSTEYDTNDNDNENIKSSNTKNLDLDYITCLYCSNYKPKNSKCSASYTTTDKIVSGS